jgi:hypothetical protein
MERPQKLAQIWSERELSERLGIPVSANGRSRVLSAWIREGLPYISKSDRRFFFEGDLITFLWNCQERSETDISDPF